jgi:hypothetical protein
MHACMYACMYVCMSVHVYIIAVFSPQGQAGRRIAQLPRESAWAGCVLYQVRRLAAAPKGARGKARTHQCCSILPASPPQHAMIRAATVGCQLWQFGSSAFATASSSAVALPVMTSATLDRKRSQAPSQRTFKPAQHRRRWPPGTVLRCAAHPCLLALVTSARSAIRNATIAARAWAGVRAAATCSAVFLPPSAVRRCRRVWSSGTLQGLHARYGLSAGTTRGVLWGYFGGTLGALWGNPGRVSEVRYRYSGVLCGVR